MKVKLAWKRESLAGRVPAKAEVVTAGTAITIAISPHCDGVIHLTGRALRRGPERSNQSVTE